MRVIIGHRTSGGTTHWFYVAGFAAQAYPFTLMFWGCQNALNVGYGVSLNQEAQTVLQNTVAIGAAASGISQLQTFDSTANGTADNLNGSHTAFAINEWHHFCGVWASATDRRLYFDGVQVGSQTTSRVVANLDQRRVGGKGNNTTNANRWSGWTCEHAILNIGLTSTQVANYFSHGDIKIFGRNIVAYFPCASVTSSQGSDLMSVGPWPGGSTGYTEPTAPHPKQFAHYSLNEAA